MDRGYTARAFPRSTQRASFSIVLKGDLAFYLSALFLIGLIYQLLHILAGVIPTIAVLMITFVCLSLSMNATVRVSRELYRLRILTRLDAITSLGTSSE